MSREGNCLGGNAPDATKHLQQQHHMRQRRGVIDEAIQERRSVTASLIAMFDAEDIAHFTT